MADEGTSKFFAPQRTTMRPRKTTPRVGRPKKTIRQPKQRQIANEFQKEEVNDTSDIKIKSKSSPTQEKRNIANIIQTSNQATCNAIEKLAKILEDKLDRAIGEKTSDKKELSPITSTRTKIQPETISEMTEPVTRETQEKLERANPFDPMRDDENTRQLRMTNLRTHQNKLTKMSQDLSHELDNINVNKTEIPQVESQKDSSRMESQKSNNASNVNLFRNLSMTITSLEQKIQMNDKKHETKIEELEKKINGIEKCNCNHLTEKDELPAKKNPSLKLQLSESEEENDESDAKFTVVVDKKKKKKKKKKNTNSWNYSTQLNQNTRTYTTDNICGCNIETTTQTQI